MNQSFQSSHPEVGMVSLLYNSAMEQQTVFVQSFKLYGVDMSGFFYWHVDMKKDFDDSPSSKTHALYISLDIFLCILKLTNDHGPNLKDWWAEFWARGQPFENHLSRIFLICPCIIMLSVWTHFIFEVSHEHKNLESVLTECLSCNGVATITDVSSCWRMV